MGEEQYADDCALLEILLSPKAVAHYGTTMTDNDHSPTPILRKHCLKWREDDEGKWHCLIVIPLYQRIDKAERIVTTQYLELGSIVGQQKTDKFGDMQMWHYYGHALPLLKVDKDGSSRVSAWTEDI